MQRRMFDFARKMINGEVVGEKAYEDAQIPMYSTPDSAGCDFFSVERVVIPSLRDSGRCAPTLVHTGIKAQMQPDVCLKLYNRSSNPSRGLILANGVGVIDADYFNNPSNDGEIMFAFLNISNHDVVIEKGQKIGQGIFEQVYKPEMGTIRVGSASREGGFGSTGIS